MTEPTPEMIEAGAECARQFATEGGGKADDIAKRIYLAMQAVAPDGRERRVKPLEWIEGALRTGGVYFQSRAQYHDEAGYRIVPTGLVWQASGSMIGTFPTLLDAQAACQHDREAAFRSMSAPLPPLPEGV